MASAEGDQVALALRRQRSSREARTETTTDRLRGWSGCSRRGGEGCSGRDRRDQSVGIDGWLILAHVVRREVVGLAKSRVDVLSGRDGGESIGGGLGACNGHADLIDLMLTCVVANAHVFKTLASKVTLLAMSIQIVLIEWS